MQAEEELKKIILKKTGWPVGKGNLTTFNSLFGIPVGFAFVGNANIAFNSLFGILLRDILIFRKDIVFAFNSLFGIQFEKAEEYFKMIDLSTPFSGFGFLCGGS